MSYKNFITKLFNVNPSDLLKVTDTDGKDGSIILKITVTISAETENNEVVNLRLKRSEVTFLDEGIWKKVIDSQGNTGWIKENR